MPDTMLELAAGAVQKEIAFEPREDDDTLYLVEGGYRSAEYFIDIARAVLNALGEPDAAALKAGAEADAEGSETNARDVWQAMLGAMLAEGV